MERKRKRFLETEIWHLPFIILILSFISCHLSNFVTTLDIRENKYIPEKVTTDLETVDKAIMKSKCHQIVLLTKNINLENTFSFEEIESTDVMMINCFCGMVERGTALFLALTIVRNLHYRKSPTRHEQDLNLHKTWVQALLNEVMQ